MLLFRGYTYSWRNYKKCGNYWTCSSHQKKGCKANVTTDERVKPFLLIKVNPHHNHSPPKLKIASDIDFE